MQHAYVAHSLIDLLRQLSPSFKRNFELLLKTRASKHPFERVPSPYQVYSWLAPNFEHTPDSIRKEEGWLVFTFYTYPNKLIMIKQFNFFNFNF